MAAMPLLSTRTWRLQYGGEPYMSHGLIDADIGAFLSRTEDARLEADYSIETKPVEEADADAARAVHEMATTFVKQVESRLEKIKSAANTLPDDSLGYGPPNSHTDRSRP